MSQFDRAAYTRCPTCGSRDIAWSEEQARDRAAYEQRQEAARAAAEGSARDEILREVQP